ncbi:Crp/Fnr family transcriptional regulator [Bergeyella porcorum]|uniref:Crp/Fnr family transcriptional regulator n=1 Tax=Bergeyella porcorum TaxID=1735111 RepID=UPI0035E7A7CE
MNWSIALKDKYLAWRQNEPLLMEKLAENKSFPKGTHIIKEGTSDPHFYFIEKGFVRGFYTDHWGNENTLFLPEEGFFFGAPECIFDQKKTTKYTFEALSDIEVIVFNFKELEQQAMQNQYVFDFYNTALKNVVTAFIHRLEAFIEESPEERYVNIDKVRPNLAYLSLRKYLASFLGISPNSLSRIRKRLKIKKN